MNERYLEGLAARIEESCAARHGAPIATMVEALVRTYWAAKTERPEATRALYRSVAELDNEALISGFSARVDTATGAMLASAADAAFDDLPTVILTLLTTIFGTVRSAFERSLPEPVGAALCGQLVLMCLAYLDAARTPPLRVIAA